MNPQLEKIKILFKEKKLHSPNNFSDYKNTNSPIEIICNGNHITKIKAKSFLYYNWGCPVCSRIKKKELLKIIINDENKKICNCCNEIKNKSLFGKNKNFEDGLRRTCKLCRKKQHKSHMMTNGETMKNIQMIRALKYIKTHPFRFLLSRAKSNHKRKGFIEEMNIDEDYIQSLYYLQSKKCYWSNVDLDIQNIGTGKLNNISVDRLDSTKGYIKGNIVLCMKFINLGRGDIDKDIFRIFLKNELNIDNEANQIMIDRNLLQL